MFNIISNLKLKETKQTLVIGIKEKNICEQFAPIINKLKESKTCLFKLGEITEYYPLSDFAADAIVFVGLGDKEKYEISDIQTIFANLYKKITKESVIVLDSFFALYEDVQTLVEKITETIGLVRYEFAGYKTSGNKKTQGQVHFLTNLDIASAIKSGEINATATNHARSLVNEPRNMLTPSKLAQYAKDLALELGLEFKIYDRKEIESLKMGAFLAVNQGSREEARLIHLKYRNNPESNEITTLIGKGLTYDSGGYSIKSKDGMPSMKTDMAGAAAVLGAIEAIARKGLKANVDVVIAATENLINSDAIVPDDVVVAMNGKTIEILNTDAEGRLTLVDAVTYAKVNNASRIVDVATLTGGVVTALGTDITGGFTNNQAFFEEVKNAAKRANEDIWQLPVDQFRERCRKSDVADYNNSPGRDGHASFGAAMIAEFAEDTPWVHLDIAGTAYKKSGYLLGPIGATGVMVRTLISLFE